MKMMYGQHNINRALITTGAGLVISYSLMVYLTLYYLDTYQASFRDFIYNLNLFFTPAQFYESMARLKPPLIASYVHIAICDMFVLFFYAFFGTLLTIKLLSYFQGLTNLWTWKASFFIVAALANIFADLSLIVLFTNYPTQLPLLVIGANWLTLIKFGFLMLGVIYIIYLSLLLKYYPNP